ncbi:MAG: tRNA (adenosine(37)-N6)-dimethylallyltransferase MiaA [Candidatus Moranbacteria bacterium CG23_combo_of_CG06-09_8_20_14_all_35_22]|nr:MAG: tRNA (adenosine(37)-N6)-dimethylallyltransferase MiaA [Candidatus Moranbacteria bacterium CG23_combo_of_CG06-09_8_20_14_all_35_22]
MQIRKYANNKIIVILGPTSSGKSDVAISLARKFNGEIISADSRQIYRGMDVGTGKIEKDNSYPSLPLGDLPRLQAGMSRTRDREGGAFYSEGIPHYGINIVSPKTNYNATKFKKYTNKIITDILKQGKIPIICGGTGFWIKAIVDNVIYPEVAPNWLLRNKLSNKTTPQLFAMLKKLDPVRAKNIDAKNPVRLIRAIEICKSIGKIPSIYELRNKRKYETLQIGINLPKEKLYQNIQKRLKQRFSAGMIKEVKKLHFENKISWKRLESFGLGYSLIPKYFRGEISSKEKLFEQIYLAEKNYAKRQMTWFQKDKRIIWLEKYLEIEKEVRKFLK